MYNSFCSTSGLFAPTMYNRFDGVRGMFAGRSFATGR